MSDFECPLPSVILSEAKNLKNSTWHSSQHFRFFAALRMTLASGFAYLYLALLLYMSFTH